MHSFSKIVPGQNQTRSSAVQAVFNPGTKALNKPKTRVTLLLVLGLYILFGLISKEKSSMHFLKSQPKSEASEQWERASIKTLPDPPTPPPPLPPPLPPQSGESEREGLAGWRRRAVPSSLMFPSSSTRSSGEDNPVCAPMCQFTGPKWHCWEESMFLS